VNTQRILAVIAAILFVGAVGLATIGPRMMLLGEALAWLNPDAEAGLHAWLLRVFGPWSWTYAARPLLIRPAWLPLGSLGLIFAGIALSWPPPPDATRRSHRRS
jgi:hypothetical protein